MVDFFLLAVSAFLLFAVVLPLFGVIVGASAYYLLPYLFGGIAMLTLGLFSGTGGLLSWWLWLPALLWAALVLLIRRKFRALGVKIEHHHAAHTVLLAGVPYHRKKKQLLLMGSE